MARVKEVARATTDRPIEFEVMDGVFGTTVILGMSRDDEADAMRVHEAVVEACRLENLPLNTIVNLVPSRSDRN